MDRGRRNWDDIIVGGLRECIIVLVDGNHDESPRSRAYLRVAPTWNGFQLKGETGRQKG